MRLTIVCFVCLSAAADATEFETVLAGWRISSKKLPSYKARTSDTTRGSPKSESTFTHGTVKNA